MIDKKRSREEAKLENARVSKANKIQRMHDTVRDQISALNPEERAKAAAAARKKNSCGQIPMHKYTEQFGDKTAAIKVLLVCHSLYTYLPTF